MMMHEIKDYFKRARHAMVYGQIHCQDVLDARILRSFLQIPREIYLPPEMQSYAYADKHLALPDGMTMMRPSLLARLIQLADIQDHESVLSIGPAYSHAILEECVTCVNGPAPFDVILFSSGMVLDPDFNESDLYVPHMFQELLQNLKPDVGRLVCVCGPSPHYGYAYVMRKLAHDHITSARHFDATAIVYSAHSAA